MESATAEHAPSAQRRYDWLIPRSRPLQATIVITLAWSAARLIIGTAGTSGSTTQHCLTGIGITLVVVCGIGAVSPLWSRHRLDLRVQYVATGEPDDSSWEVPAASVFTDESAPMKPTLRETTHDETESMRPEITSPRSVESAERAHLAKATLALLRQQTECDSTLEVPIVWLIRVGVVGVEVLLATADDRPVPGFLSDGGGLVWRLESLDELATLFVGEDLSDLEELSVLGEDDESTYFVGPDLEYPPFCDQLPIDDQSDDHSFFGAGLSLFETDEATILEPFGLHLQRAAESLRSMQPPSEVELSSPGESPATIEEFEDEKNEFLVAEMAEADELIGLVCVDDFEGDLSEVTERPAKQDQLVLPGKVEVRVLREEPDLVGELNGEPTAAAVDLLAYLVLHGHRATTSRLRDSIGTTRTQASRSGKTVWSAASAARKVLGTDLFPGASGNQLYKLSAAVTGDWLRFLDLVEIARKSESDSERQREALIQALSLVDGVPAIASRRFLWLDDEGILREITKEVVSASVKLADLELEVGSSEVARWALDKGLILSPSDSQLLELEQLLNNSTAVR